MTTLNQPVRPDAAAARLLRGCALLAVAGAAVIAVDASGLVGTLRAAHPTYSAAEISSAQSWILTYLFVLAAVAVVIWLLAARAQRTGSAVAIRVAVGAAIVGTALAGYHFTQPHPLLMTLAGLVPAVVALLVTLRIATRR